MTSCCRGLPPSRPSAVATRLTSSPRPFDSGTDTITDFGAVDRIELDAVALGIVGLTASQVISQFRSVEGADSVFDFGDGNILIVEDRAGGAFFQDRIDIL